MEKDDLLREEYKEMMNGLRATEETRKRVKNITETAKEEGTEASANSVKRKKIFHGRFAVAACLALVIVGLGTIGVKALIDRKPMPEYSPDNESLDENDTIFTESNEKVEADEYVISYDGIIYDDELKVGYMSFLCRRTDGQPLTQIEKNRIKRGDFARKDAYFEGLWPQIADMGVSIGDAELHMFMFPVLGCSSFYREEEGGVRVYCKFDVSENPQYWDIERIVESFLNKDNEEYEEEILPNELKVAVLTSEQYENFMKEKKKITDIDAFWTLLSKYGMKKAEYSSGYLKTVSNDIITVKIGRTDISAEWKWEDNIETIVIVREDGSEIIAWEEEKFGTNQGENVPMGHWNDEEITIIFPYGDILRVDEMVRIKVNGEFID